MLEGQQKQMLSVEEALQHILELVYPLELERVAILDALDRVLGEDVYAPADIPPFPNSAMDGYAVRSADTAGARKDGPAVLQVIGEVAAGHTTALSLAPGTAIRIMTGAPLPAEADAVVRFEDTDEPGRGAPHRDLVSVYVPAWAGLNVRLAGEDVQAGERVLAAGALLRPSEIGLLASVGRPEVAVYRRPRVAILATGDELLDISEPMQPGKIRNSNEYSTAALVLRYGGVPVRLGIARDTVEDLTAKLRQALQAGVDMILTSAGVSVGDFDVVKDVLSALGRIAFWQVRMKPGKPLAFGSIDGVPLVGLPGNPVSAMVSFEQFVRPALRRMQGRRACRRQIMPAVLDEDVENTSHRRQYIRAVVVSEGGRYMARTTGGQGSGILTSMVKANALLVIPETMTLAHRGETVPAEMLDWPEIE